MSSLTHTRRGTTMTAHASVAVGFALTAGIALTAAGLIGFAMTGWHGFVDVEGVSLLGLSVNPLQNLLHVLTGLVLIVGASISRQAGWVVTLLASAAFGVLGLVGLMLVGTPANHLALDAAGNAVHLGLAVVGTAVALLE